RAHVALFEIELAPRGGVAGDEHAERVEHDLRVGAHLERRVTKAGVIRVFRHVVLPPGLRQQQAIAVADLGDRLEDPSLQVHGLEYGGGGADVTASATHDGYVGHC